ncbi:MAG: hypothetical protein IJT15_02860 [Rickettsiales bacterium]|nr:hypothetical protein [Rickettsiales bacterium]
MSNYEGKLKQLVDSLYSSFLTNYNIADYKEVIDGHANSNQDTKLDGILSEIKKTFLLDSNQKDCLFQKYYNLLIDGCENIDDNSAKQNIRKIIFNHLKEKKLFNDLHIAIDLVKSKFKQEMEEMQQQIVQEKQKAILEAQRLEKERQSKHIEHSSQQMVDSSGIQQPTMQRDLSINKDNTYNVNNQPDNNISLDRVENDNDINDDIGYGDNNFFEQVANEQMASYNPPANEHSIQLNEYERNDVPKQTFSANDFYRYKNINNMITNRTKVLIENEYNFVKNEIKNIQIAKNTFDKIDNKNNENDIMDLNKKDSNARTNLLMQQPNLQKNKIQQAYNNTHKDIQNSIVFGDGKISDKNKLSAEVPIRR